MAKNFTMKVDVNGSWQELHPKTNVDQVEGLEQIEAAIDNLTPRVTVVEGAASAAQTTADNAMTRAVQAEATAIAAAAQDATAKADAAAAASIPLVQKGVNGGVATLDNTGKVPASQLPTQEKDVLELPTFADFPTVGEAGKIYIAIDTNQSYRWSGTEYTEISSSLSLGETAGTAYRGDRGKIAYDHSQLTTGNPHGTTAIDVGADPVGSAAAAEAAAKAASIPLVQKGSNSGVAELDENGKVPAGQLPTMNYVPTTRKVNGKALSADITLTAGDIGASGKLVARFTVGASTAGWTSDDCDYLCDGTADQTEINAAITALPATGGEIVILDGTYNITAKIDVTKDNVSIRGNGNATILKRMYNSTDFEGVITLAGRNGCKIANLQVDGNNASFTDIYNRGILLDASNNNTITGNTCNNNLSGINLDFSSNDNTITGNTCNNNSYGISLQESSNNNTITGNTFNNNIYSGISLISSSRNTIIGNTCNGNSNGSGISLSSSNDNTITNNTCSSNGSGISLISSSGNTIIGNTCNGNGYGSGMSLLSSSNDNTITGNTCNNNNNSYGIDSQGSSNNTVTGNTCNNNTYSGINLSSGNNNTITGNTCNSNFYGIGLVEASNNTVTGNTCIRGTGSAADYTANQHTIQLYGTTNNYNLISNNNCMGKAVTVGGGTGNTLVNNKFDAT